MPTATPEHFMVFESGVFTGEQAKSACMSYIFNMVEEYNDEFPDDEVGAGRCVPKISTKQSALARIGGSKAGTYGITYLFVTDTFLKVFKRMSQLKLVDEEGNAKDNTYGCIPLNFTEEEHSRNLINEIQFKDETFTVVELHPEFESLPLSERVEMLTEKAKTLGVSEYGLSQRRFSQLFFVDDHPEVLPSLDKDDVKLNPNGLTFFLPKPFMAVLGTNAVLKDNNMVEVTVKGEPRLYPMSVVTRQGNELIVDPYGFVTEDIIKQVVAPFTFEGEARVNICDKPQTRFANVTFAWSRGSKHGNAVYAVLMTRQIEIPVPFSYGQVTLTSMLSKMSPARPAQTHRHDSYRREEPAPVRRAPHPKSRASTSSDGWTVQK